MFETGPPIATPPPPGSDFLSPTEQANIDAATKKLQETIGASLPALLADLLNPIKQAEIVAAVAAWLLAELMPILTALEKDALADMSPFIAQLVTAITTLLLPIAGQVGDIAGIFVKMVAGGIGNGVGGDAERAGAAAGNSAQYAFDNIMAPLSAFSSGTRPDQPGAGAANIQRTLGGVISIHLTAWVINVLSNLTGVGFLKFFNSFSEAILGGVNARALGRVAVKPYLTTFLTDPATKELNTTWPLKDASPVTAIKEFIRGNITAAELQARNKEQGFSEQITAQMVLDAAKLYSPALAAFYVRIGTWDTATAETALILAGYDKDVAHAELAHERAALTYELQKRYADEQGVRVANRFITTEEYSGILRTAGFSDLEVAGYVAVYNSKIQDSKRLSYAQVKELYVAGIVPLSFVNDWLLAEGYSPEDVSLLTLLDFATKEQRVELKNVLAAQARVLSLEKASASKTASTAGEAALSAALDSLSRAKATLAASFGA